MKKQVIAIGGGGFGRNPVNLDIETYILNQVNVSKPKICFIPSATGDDKAYIVNFYKAFNRLHCRPTHLEFFARTPDLDSLVSSQDVLFVGGGNTKSMLAVWNDWDLPMLLERAYQRGVVLAGVSAGAICWFNKGITDSWASSLQLMDCLGFINGNCCPHYDEEEERRPALKNFLTSGSIDNCFAIEGGCALHFVDGKIKEAVSFVSNKNAYLTLIENGVVREQKIKNRVIFKKN